MGRRAIALAFCLMPMSAAPDILTFNLWPTGNPSGNLSCLIVMANGQITMVEVRGTGMPPRHPMRWPIRPEEEAAVLSALQALIIGDLVGADVYAAPSPQPPYLTLTWSTKVNGARVSGLYVQDRKSVV